MTNGYTGDKPTIDELLRDFLEAVPLEHVAKCWPMDESNDYGNVQEWSNDYCHALYGNRELAIYVDDIEEPFTYVIDIYGDDLILVET